jgi:hypothetical protein
LLAVAREKKTTTAHHYPRRNGFYRTIHISTMSQDSPPSQFAQWNPPSDTTYGYSSPSSRPQSTGIVQSYSTTGINLEDSAPSHTRNSSLNRASHVKRIPLVDYSSFSPPSTVSSPYQNAETSTAYGSPSVAPTKDTRLVGPAPPSAEPQVAFTLPAPRLYHRMITEYETVKAVFYTAQTRKHTLHQTKW